MHPLIQGSSQDCSGGVWTLFIGFSAPNNNLQEIDEYIEMTLKHINNKEC
jgi:hypothetical protein